MAETKNAIPTELGTEKIGRLLKQYALPAIIAQTASSLYNMVDSIFIGQGVGPLAISGLAVTFPLMNLSTAFGTLVGAGAATMLSVLLGQKNYKAANKVLGNVVTLNTIIGLVFMAVALIFIDPILYFFGASENTLPYAKEYISIILIGNVITHLYFGLNAAMRSSGNPKKAMGLTIFTVVFNTILDPIFIFVLDMGIAGAAWATVIAQTIAMLIVMSHFNDKRRPFHFEGGEGFTFDRNGSFPDECRSMSGNSFHQPAVEEIQRRPRNRSIWNMQPVHLHVHHDLHGSEPGNAAYRRIQLRGTSVFKSKRSILEDGKARHIDDHGMLHLRYVPAKDCSKHIHS